MKNVKKILLTGMGVFIISLFNSSTIAQAEEEVGDDGATIVVCTCRGVGKCVANGDNGPQCNVTNNCAKENNICM